jgi:hypothetical protein
VAARKRKVRLPDSWKDKLSVSMLMNRLVNHVNGEIELTATQVRAAEIVLSKVVPSLASVQSEVTVTSYRDVLERLAGNDLPLPMPADVANAALLASKEQTIQ